MFFHLSIYKFIFDNAETGSERKSDYPLENKNIENYDEHVDILKVREFLGEKLYLSKSKISSFMLCPYKYWCDYVLKLRENKSGNINPAEIGNIVHYILDKYLQCEYRADDTTEGDEKKAPKKFLHSHDSDYVFTRTGEILEDYVNKINFIPSSSTIHALSRYRDIAYHMIMNIQEEFQKSQFEMIAFEEDIEYGKKLKPFEIEVPIDDNFKSKVILHGRVDRIDAFKKDDTAYIRIIDYKTGDESFKIDKITEGKDIQLPIYLFAAADAVNHDSPIYDSLKKDDNGDTSEINIVPASAVYLAIKEEHGEIKPRRTGFILKDPDVVNAANSEGKFTFIAGDSKPRNPDKTPTSHFEPEQIDEAKQLLISTASKIAKDLYSGDVSRCPSEDACKFCKIKSQCPVAKKDKKF